MVPATAAKDPACCHHNCSPRPRAAWSLSFQISLLSQQSRAKYGLRKAHSPSLVLITIVNRYIHCTSRSLSPAAHASHHITHGQHPRHGLHEILTGEVHQKVSGLRINHGCQGVGKRARDDMRLMCLCYPHHHFHRYCRSPGDPYRLEATANAAYNLIGVSAYLALGPETSRLLRALHHFWCAPLFTMTPVI